MLCFEDTQSWITGTLTEAVFVYLRVRHLKPSFLRNVALPFEIVWMLYALCIASVQFNVTKCNYFHTTELIPHPQTSLFQVFPFQKQSGLYFLELVSRCMYQPMTKGKGNIGNDAYIYYT